MLNILPFIISQAWGLWPDFPSVSGGPGPGADGVHGHYDREGITAHDLGGHGNGQQQQQPPPPLTAVQTIHSDSWEEEVMLDMQAALRALEEARDRLSQHTVIDGGRG